MNSLAARCEAHAELSDEQLASDFLSTLSVHASASEETLRALSARALGFGIDLAGELSPHVNCSVLDTSGGVTRDSIVLAEYSTRPHAITIYSDAIALAEELIGWLGWRSWYPVGSVRSAALLHEEVHAKLHNGHAKRLRRSIGHTLIRVGSWRLNAHVVGADEIAAHGYVQAVLGLERSPLLLTAALSVLAGDNPEAGITGRPTTTMEH